MKVFIVGLNKVDILLNLYNGAKFSGPVHASQPFMAQMGAMGLPGQREAAEAVIKEAIETNRYRFDYIDLGAGSRPLKVDLSSFDFDPTNYDKEHGPAGYAAAIIDKLRSEMIEENQSAPKDSLASLLSIVGMAFKSNTGSEPSPDHASSPGKSA